MKSIIRAVLISIVCLVSFTPLFASAASFSFGVSWGSGAGGGCIGGICDVAKNILNIINGILVPIIFALAFIVFLYGVAKAYIFSGGSEEGVKQGHRLILWGLIGFVVMISLWGLVNVVATTFGLTGGGAPGSAGGLPLPQSR